MSGTRQVLVVPASVASGFDGSQIFSEAGVKEFRVRKRLPQSCQHLTYA